MTFLSSFRSSFRPALVSALLVPGLVLAPLAHAQGSCQPAPDAQQAHDTSAGFHTSAQACAGGQFRGPLHSGQCVLVTATGFLTGQKVVVREYRQPGWRQDQVADSRGSLTLRFRVPPTANATTDALTFTGIEQSRPQPGTGPVVVTLPHAAAFRFVRVR